MRDGVVLVAKGPLPITIQRVSAGGGTPTPVTTLDPSRQEIAHAWPQFLPDGTHFLYLAVSKTGNDAIYVGSLDSKERTLLLNANSNAVYSPPGYLLYHREGTLMAQPFDTERIQLTGEPVPIAEGLQFERMTGSGSFCRLREWRAGLPRRNWNASAHVGVDQPHRDGTGGGRPSTSL